MTAEAVVPEQVVRSGPSTARPRVVWLGDPEAAGDLMVAETEADTGRVEADVVHVVGAGYDLAAVRRAAPDAAIVLDFGSDGIGRLGRWGARRVRDADLLIVPTPGDLRRLGGELARRAAVVPAAIDLDRYAPLEQLAKERTQDARLKRFRRVHRLAGPTVLFAGPYTEAGGLDLLLDAVFAIRERVPDLRLAAVPHGRVDARFRDDCEGRALLLGHHCVIEWQRVEDELPLWYALSTVVCSPGSADAEPARLAAAAGRPYVAAAGAAAAAELQDGTTGFVVPAGEPETLKAAIEALVGDGEEAARLGRNGREWAERELGRTAVAKRRRQLWDEAFQRRARGAGGASHRG